ncbi:MAG TPA: HEAT repeat domain-containing protein [Candidatus Sulfotelmatobacter sp.]|nr:HEAT repeat domain-containing protein [Candidatus Sulfotelmatobacter sp.]
MARRKVAASVLLLALAAVACSRGPEQRIRSLHAAGRAPSSAGKRSVARALGDPDRDVRANALVVMNSIDAAAAISMARSAAADPDAVVRATAVRVLAGATDPDTFHRLVELATSDPAWQVRAGAIDVIAASDDPAVDVALQAALQDHVRRVRRRALAAGLARAAPWPVDALVGLLADEPDWENRSAAVRLLGRSKDPAAFAALDAAVRDPNEFVRASATAGLQELKTDGVVRPAPPPPVVPPKRGATPRPPAPASPDPAAPAPTPSTG